MKYVPFISVYFVFALWLVWYNFERIRRVFHMLYFSPYPVQLWFTNWYLEWPLCLNIWWKKNANLHEICLRSIKVIVYGTDKFKAIIALSSPVSGWSLLKIPCHSPQWLTLDCQPEPHPLLHWTGTDRIIFSLSKVEISYSMWTII